MLEVKWNLLTEPVFSLEVNGTTTDQVPLPEVLARLAGGHQFEFAALRPHQNHSWYGFLIQLAAIAVARSGDQTIPDGATRWREMLRGLTNDHDEAWCLVVPDLKQPAFMQPPVPEESLAKWKNESCFPDEIDLLVTAKNHDLKVRRMASPRPEHWTYALVSLQTMEGFGGRSQYGIARMNGGYGNRPCIASAKSDAWSVRFLRDLKLSLTQLDDLAARYEYRRHGGYALLWTLPWDGKRQLSLRDCDPLFIEVCRRIRLIAQAGTIMARWIGSERARVDSSDRNGDLGDIWTPVRKKDAAALTARNLGYEIVQEVFFSTDWNPSAASRPLPEDGDSPVLISQVLVRGQGKTEGLHERSIPVPSRARRLLASPQGRERLGILARSRVELVSRIRKELLRPALLALLQGGPERINFADRRAGPFAAPLDQQVDEIFFARLFEDADHPENEANLDWAGRVLELARGLLHDAFDSVPIPELRRLRAIAAAERLFEGGARNRFPDLYQKQGGTDDRQPTSGC